MTVYAPLPPKLRRCSLIVSAGYSNAKKVETKASFQVAKLGRNQRFLFVSRHCNSDSISDETISSQRGELWPMKKSSSEGSPGEVAPVCGVDGGMTCSPIFYFVMVISVMESI